MDNKSNIIINNSILYRMTQKYFDHNLAEFHLGYGQIIFLLLINENEGITMAELAKMAHFDKATVTSGIQKLEKSGYVEIKNSSEDKRAKRLYTTKESADVIAKLYLTRTHYFELITKSLKIDEIDCFTDNLSKIVENAILSENTCEDTSIHFYGLQRLTLLDYPGKVAATLFTGGCNYRCPFCQNSDLVYLKENMIEINKDDILGFLDKRMGILEGVCISGGEPLLHNGLEDFIAEVKNKGFKVKLDTNGSNPNKLKELIDKGLIDYVAMDIKNSKERYGETIGKINFDLKDIEDSVEILKQSNIEYEFRTTIVKEFHTEENIKKIGQWLKGAKALYLQNFEDGENVIEHNLHAHSKEMLIEFKKILEKDIDIVEIRGI